MSLSLHRWILIVLVKVWKNLFIRYYDEYIDIYVRYVIPKNKPKDMEYGIK